ncbi:MAG TPA: PepSY domain-containing protein [Methylotenera sp.]
MTFKSNIFKLSYVATLLVAALALQFVSAASFVSADESQLTARKLSEAGLILPLEKINKAAKNIKAGKILETELELKNGVYIYEVEILDDKSQVWELKLDAKTGKLIKLELED